MFFPPWGKKVFVIDLSSSKQDHANSDISHEYLTLEYLIAGIYYFN